MKSNARPLAPVPQPRRPEAGYAMLMVFLMAAMIAIAMYNELPRVVFEAQRTKEQLLIERGEQYKRAIQLFVRKMSRYPATIEELESTNNIRFLRKRYIDPMTGKDKWRLIHINGGVLTDSIVPKDKPGQAPGQGQDSTQQANTNTFIGEGPVMGATNDPSQQQINPALRRRASDDRPVVTQEVPDEPAQADAADDNSDNNNNDNNDNSDDTPAPVTPGTAAVNPGMPNQQMPGMPPGRVQPGMYQPGAYPGQPGFNPAMANQQFGANGAPNQFSSPGISGFPNNGGFPNNNNNGQGSDSSSSSGVYAAPGLGSQPAPVNTGAQMGGMPGQPNGFPNQPGAFGGQPGGMPGRIGGFPQPGGGIPGQGFPGQGFQNQGGMGLNQNTPSAFNNNGGGMGQNQNQNQNQPSAFGNNFGLNGPSNIQSPGGGLPGMGGTQMGGGIAGVATEYKGPAIKIYNERKKYNEWEFVYDQSKDRGLAGVQKGGGAPGTPAQNMGSMPAGPGQPGGLGGPGNPGGAIGPGSSTFNSPFTQSPQQQPPQQQQQPQN